MIKVKTQRYMIITIIPYLEKTWVNSCSVQVGPKFATNSVAHGGAIFGPEGAEELFCRWKGSL